LKQRRALGALFALLAIGFAGIGFAAAYGARNAGAGWIIALAAVALAVWFASLAYRGLR
jgi:hypothetical protein